MNRLKLFSILATALICFSCEEDENSLGTIEAPTNLEMSYEIVGQNDQNPFGDGSGVVNFSASANQALNYRFDFGDGQNSTSSDGTAQYQFVQTGVNEYTVTVTAFGKAGIATSNTIDLRVFSAFSDEEAERFLSGPNVGDSKTWYWAADEPLHVGLGPVEDDYGSGEFGYEAWWSAIQPYDEEKYCMYTDKFVFTHTTDGLTFEQIDGPAYVPGAYSSEIGLDGELCYGDEVIPVDMYGVKNVQLLPSSSKAANEGLYNGEEYRGTSFMISDGGFMGWYVGSSTYDIISISDTELRVRVIQNNGFIYPDGGYAWYAKYITEDPLD